MGLVDAIQRLEADLEGSDFKWLLRQHDGGTYFANITDKFARTRFPAYGETAVGALQASHASYRAWWKAGADRFVREIFK